VVKRIPLMELFERIKAIEGKYGGDLSQLHDEFVTGRMERDRFEDYVDWSSMNHALRAYSEGEDYDYCAEIELKLEREDYEKLTPRRLELLEQLSQIPVNSINDLAEKIGRDVKNVYNDLKKLESLGFIRLVDEGRSLKPEVLVQEITHLQFQ
jgi:predicted transcriptional regulator